MSQPTIEALTERMQAARRRALAAGRRWELYEGSKAEKDAAEAEFAQAFDAYHKARFGNKKAPSIRSLLR